MTEPRENTLPVSHLGFGLVICCALSLFGCRSDSTDAPEDSASSATNVESRQGAADKTFAERGYVGSQACSECHGDISASYAKHSMGKSAAVVTADSTVPGDSARFDADGFRYQVLHENGKTIHRQSRLTVGGRETAVIDQSVAHVIGSGNHGQSFLVDRDGYLFMSPMTWYPDKDIWALSPGYEKSNSQFNRPVLGVCLYCHTDGACAVPHVVNQYQSPPMHGHTIGCERCHGPGQSHIAAQENGETKANIVNPANLSTELSEAVCQQCHLSGAARVVKPNRSLYDFQPGQPLESAYTIYTVKSDEDRFVGHVEQMHTSACFRQSDGKLGCVSCHDPHSLPAPDQKIEFYRDRCFACHASESCSLELPKRTEVTAEDSCIVCHMPKLETEILHAAATDHSVPRKPDSQPTSSGDTLRLAPFPSRAAAKPSPRDDALAIVQASAKYPQLLDDTQFEVALKALEQAVAKDEWDFEAAEALADLYLANNDTGDAMKLCRGVLEKEPGRETTLLLICEMLSRLGDHQQAIVHWTRIIETNPWMVKYWFRLAQSHAAIGQWAECRDVTLKGKERFPTSIGLRQLLVSSSLELDDPATADAEFAELVEFNPPGIESLQDWYEKHPKRQASTFGPQP